MRSISFVGCRPRLRSTRSVPETGIDRVTVANAEEHTTLLTRLVGRHRLEAVVTEERRAAW